MTLTTIYSARHGFRSNWLPPPHPPNPTGIDSDPALAPHGVEQAQELANFIANLPPHEQPQMIISSPFYRCVETCAPLAKALGLKVHIDRGIGEWFRENRPHIPTPATCDQLRSLFPVVGYEWNNDSGVIPNATGESEDAILDRARNFWLCFFSVMETKFPSVERVILVSHAATKIALASALLGIGLHEDVTVGKKLEKIKAGACSLDTFVYDGKWKMTANGATHFLKGGEEMNWNFDVKVEAGSDEDIKRRMAEAGGHDAAERKDDSKYEVRTKL